MPNVPNSQIHDNDLALTLTENEPPLTQPEPPLTRLPDPADHDDDPEEFRRWIDELLPPPEPLAGPLVPCEPLTPESLKVYEPESNFRKIELAHQLLKRGPFGLSDIWAWEGEDAGGILALYYQGPLEIYRFLTDPRSRLPMTIASGTDVIGRAKNFVESFNQVGLGIENFTARFLPLPAHLKDDARKQLLDLYRPVWDTFDGLGSHQHAVDSRAAATVRSKWDTLHRGRPGAGGIERDDDVFAQLESTIPRILSRYRTAERWLESYADLEGSR